MDTLRIIVTGQALFAAVLLLWVRRPLSARQCLLSVVLIAFASTFASSMQSVQSAYVSYPFIAIVFYMASLLLGPAVYLYAKQLTLARDEILWSPLWPHLLPILLGLIIACSWLAIYTAQQAHLAVEPLAAPTLSQRIADGLSNSAFILSEVQGLTYLFLSLWRLSRHRMRSRDFFSNLSEHNLNWLQQAVRLMTSIWLVSLLLHLVARFHSVAGIWFDLVTVSNTLVFYILFFRGLNQTEVTLPALIAPPYPVLTQTPVEKTSVRPITSSAKYSKSGLDTEQMQRIAGKLDQAIELDQIHLRPSLTLIELSQHINTPSFYVSQTLSQVKQQKFYDFIAQHRIQAATSLLTQNHNQAILDIAMAVGFNSKSAFNAAFKKQTGVTPSQYRQRQSSVA